ncbi:predicted protein [Postia placenta Mad-698-R]|nr:predicted protein [Postia placenta Mad-698-R]
MSAEIAEKTVRHIPKGTPAEFTGLSTIRHTSTTATVCHSNWQGHETVGKVIAPFKEGQTFPEDFDGVPSNSTCFVNANVWENIIHPEVLRQCDTIVRLPLKDTDVLSQSGCLTLDQIALVQRIYSDYVVDGEEKCESGLMSSKPFSVGEDWFRYFVFKPHQPRTGGRSGHNGKLLQYPYVYRILNSSTKTAAEVLVGAGSLNHEEAGHQTFPASSSRSIFPHRTSPSVTSDLQPQSSFSQVRSHSISSTDGHALTTKEPDPDNQLNVITQHISSRTTDRASRTARELPEDLIHLHVRIEDLVDLIHNLQHALLEAGAYHVLRE